MSQIRVRNRLRHFENIAKATVEIFQPPQPQPVRSGVTNNLGVVNLDTKALADGIYLCTVSPRDASADPVGPAIASDSHPPDRIFRTSSMDLTLRGGVISTATAQNDLDGTVAQDGNASLAVTLQPVWMKSPVNSHRGEKVTTIIIHHTACGTGPAVATFMSEKGPHYMIDTDGQIVKFVQDTRSAAHAGEARWFGKSAINASSIGIEIVNTTGPYPEAQYKALLELLDRLRNYLADFQPWNTIGHSDVGTDKSGKLGRKSGDPGDKFEWARVEKIGLGLQMAAGPWPSNIYGGFFDVVPNGSLRDGDNDAKQRFGGAKQEKVTGQPVQELQTDLSGIGYSVGKPDGDFGGRTARAVTAFQEHFFAGGRGHKPADGRVDLKTAMLIKSVRALAPPAQVPS